MNIEMITREDLLAFKREIIEEIRMIVNQPKQSEKQWLRSADVRNLLKISPGTLQNMRISGTIKYTKVGGIYYYSHNEITTLLKNNERV
jgi:hypothetical protein